MAYNEGLCPSHGDINRLMMMKTFFKIFLSLQRYIIMKYLIKDMTIKVKLFLRLTYNPFVVSSKSLTASLGVKLFHVLNTTINMTDIF
jgi:hypothetical protein